MHVLLAPVEPKKLDRTCAMIAQWCFCTHIPAHCMTFGGAQLCHRHHGRYGGRWSRPFSSFVSLFAVPLLAPHLLVLPLGLRHDVSVPPLLLLLLLLRRAAVGKNERRDQTLERWES
eukprot:TRINITY_DN4320_c0_g1_i1.p3 TRINITY_DN4320_c0_g1~~TRINITY_DN4320_c0_g1_i1.p3  ORF type:complete len:117 (+),score=10.96 TRINITY_DN4320_c0_g1_i1:109-459(+)